MNMTLQTVEIWLGVIRIFVFADWALRTSVAPRWKLVLRMLIFAGLIVTSFYDLIAAGGRWHDVEWVLKEFLFIIIGFGIIRTDLRTYRGDSDWAKN